MRTVLLSLLLLAAPLHAQNSDSSSADFMYNACRQYEAFAEGDTLAPDEQIKAVNCVSYMTGFFNAYNFKTAKTCDLTTRSPNELVKTFLATVRNLPVASRETPTTIVVGSIVDNCFCREDPEFAKVICPVIPGR